MSNYSLAIAEATQWLDPDEPKVLVARDLPNARLARPLALAAAKHPNQGVSGYIERFCEQQDDRERAQQVTDFKS